MRSRQRSTEQDSADHAMMQSPQQVGAADDMYSLKTVQQCSCQGQVRVWHAMHCLLLSQHVQATDGFLDILY